MINLIINNKEINVPENTTVLEACEKLNKDIPKFCFNESLQIAGNCRMCLVEVENSPKPVVSCSLPVTENMKVFTNTPLIKKARETVLELLLINHPLDCPICDQAGECDLQDLTVTFGSDRSRFSLSKRAIEDKKYDTFIKTLMTRCIHCTRCVRFTQENYMVDKLGTTGRGTNTEITPYLNKLYSSEYSGTVADLCPVGALTSKPTSFKERYWGVQDQLTANLFDSFGTRILVQTYANNILKVLPIINSRLNIDWINNKTRFFFDGNMRGRIKEPQIKKKGKFIPISWTKAFQILKSKANETDGAKKQAYIGDFISLDEYMFFKHYMKMLGVKFILPEGYNWDSIRVNSDINNNFLCPLLIEKLKHSKKCLLINYNPRINSSFLFLKLNDLIKSTNLKVFYLGPQHKSVPYKSVEEEQGKNEDPLILYKILLGKHFFCKKLLQDKHFTIITSYNSFRQQDFSLLNLLKKKFNKNLNIITEKPSNLNYLEIIGTPKPLKNINPTFLFYYNTDSSILKQNKKCFKIYCGHHYSENTTESDLILPVRTFLEKSNIFLNIEGEILKTKKIQKLAIGKDDKELFKSLMKSYKSNSEEIDTFNFKTLENQEFGIFSPIITNIQNTKEKIKVKVTDGNQLILSQIVEKERKEKVIRVSTNSYLNFKKSQQNFDTFIKIPKTYKQQVSLLYPNNIFEKHSHILENLFAKPIVT